MKIQQRYKLLNHAKQDYSKRFGHDYQFKKISRKDLHKLIDGNRYALMCEWWYCCYGLYKNCWQEPYEKGIWGLTQQGVDTAIKEVIDSTAKICRKDSRILYYEEDCGIHIVIVARDVLQCDFLIGLPYTDPRPYTPAKE